MGNNENIYKGDIYTLYIIETKFGSKNVIAGPNSLVTKAATLIKIDEDTFAELDSFKTTIENGKVVMTCLEKDYLKTFPTSTCCHYVDESSLTRLSSIEEAHTEIEKSNHIYSYNIGSGM